MLLMITCPMKKTIACIPSRKDAGITSALSSATKVGTLGPAISIAAMIEAEIAPTAPITPYPSSTSRTAIRSLEVASRM